jgi:hypothetical protein
MRTSAPSGMEERSVNPPGSTSFAAAPSLEVSAPPQLLYSYSGTVEQLGANSFVLTIANASSTSEMTIQIAPSTQVLALSGSITDRTIDSSSATFKSLQVGDNVAVLLDETGASTETTRVIIAPQK